MNWKPVIVGAISGLLAALTVDMDAFIKARSKDSEATFDWVLAVSRWVQGAATGAITALSANAIAG